LVAVGSSAAFAFVIAVLVHKGLAGAGVWAGIVGALASVVAAGAAVWVAVPHPSKAPPPPLPEMPNWVIDRPVEMATVLKAVLADNTTVGITTGLTGAGGFGKTILARMVCADQRVRRRFGGRVYLVTVGRDVRGAAAISAKVNDVIKLVTGEDATFTDPQLAGRRLGALLDSGPPRLLVLDDVWEPEQLTPFIEGGRGYARLVTTRVPGLLAGRGTRVQVDQMSQKQARALLTAGLPGLDSAVAEGLLAETGRWPLLLRLVNKILADYAQMAADVSGQGEMLLERLRSAGPAVVDDLTGATARELDVGEPQQRARAVRATIGASTNLLGRGDAERFAELSVFIEDEVIPFNLVAQLWQATAGLDDLQASEVCARLAQLALVSQVAGPDHGITLHDVVRDFLRAELGQPRLTELNGMLLDAVAKNLPVASPLSPLDLNSTRVAWWDLDHDNRYLWDHLIEHLLDAGRPGDAEAVAADLRWVGTRVERFGPAAPAADLFAVSTPRAARLRAVLARTAHLLAPTEPERAVVDILHSRVASDPDWGPQVAALRTICRRPRLVNRWSLPDPADPVLQRVLTGHTGQVNTVTAAPDGSWLATGGNDGTVRIWDVATGQERATLVHRTRRTDWVNAVAIAPDGSWLATGGSDGTVRIWDVATGQQRATLSRRERVALTRSTSPVSAVAVAPDGSWLGEASFGGTVRIWNVATRHEQTLTRRAGAMSALAVTPDGTRLAAASFHGALRTWDVATGQERSSFTRRERATPTHADDWVNAVAVAPDGSWLATGSFGGTVRIWDLATGQERATLMSQIGRVDALAVAPDGSWLATGSFGGTVRIWDVATGQERATLTRRTGRVNAAAVAPDGSWLATGGSDGAVRIWDVATTRQQTPTRRRTRPVNAAAVAPDGSWLATGGSDGAVRIWDVASGRQRAIVSRGTWVNTVAVAPDGSWLAAGDSDGVVRIWDAATRQERTRFSARSWVNAVAVAPDGSWLATGSFDGVVRIWDVATGQERVTTRRTVPVNAVAVAPDGSWLAAGGSDGTVRIWDVATGRQRASLGRGTDWIYAVAVAPDGSWLAAGDSDGTVRIWDVATRHERISLTGHTSQVYAVAVAPDGNWLASSSDDRTVRVWDVDSGKTQALMRVDNSVSASVWINTGVLAVGGPAGLYLFDFLSALPVVPP